MKVQLHRGRAFEMPKADRQKVLRQVSELYHLLPKGSDQGGSDEEILQRPPKIVVDYSRSLADVRRDRLRADFLKKYRGFASNTSAREAAVATFIAAEQQCKEANNRIRKMRAGVITPYVDSIMLMAQRTIAHTLGPFNVSELLSVSCWGPGATSAVSGLRVSVEKKFSVHAEVTPRFYQKGAQLMSLLPSWSALQTDTDFGTWVTPLPKVVRGNRISFVPKTVETDRIIAVEPHLNVYFQNGIGRMLRKRLLRAGVNLNDQTTNQRLARQGSLDDSLATIDLSSASDTVSRLLVEELLPEDWHQWMDLTRCAEGKFQGKWLRFEKFSSMGNGFTFDLESLIFWALSKAVCDLEQYNSFWVNVFGDDIVIPSGIYGKVVEVLSWCGFTVNDKKSFMQGPFRESCGKDYLLGADVRPVYLKDAPVTPLHWIRIANALRRLSHQWTGGLSCDPSLKSAYEYCVARIPRNMRMRIPDGFGDTGLISNLDEVNPEAWGDGWEGWKVYHLSLRAVKYETTDRSLVTASVYKIGNGSNKVPLRDVVSVREAPLFVPKKSWPNLGPWL